MCLFTQGKAQTSFVVGLFGMKEFVWREPKHRSVGKLEKSLFSLSPPSRTARYVLPSDVVRFCHYFHYENIPQWK